VVDDEAVDLVVIAGDLFDSTTVDQTTISATCQALGQCKVPVVVIPGNHDHNSPGSVWHQALFRREQQMLASNVVPALEPAPIRLGNATLFPCPLMRRSESLDTTAWLRSSEALNSADSGTARIIIAHGATRSFTSKISEDEDGYAHNFIDITRLLEADYDYLALGDWHGTKEVGNKAWYSGTPEQDRFSKGGDYSAGNILLVDINRGEPPQITPVTTGKLRWFALEHDFSDDADVSRLEARLSQLLGNEVNRDLLYLTLAGTLGFEGLRQIDMLVEWLQARLIRLKLVNRTILEPSSAEIEALTQRQADPLLARVAQRLVAQTQSDEPSAALARAALRELHAAAMSAY
jgi:DNA repair exonuclease SbcCD nuclease subunit